MISDLDDTLAALLKRELPKRLAAQVEFSFAAPDDQFAKSQKLPAIDLFLYDVRENLELRSNETYVGKRVDGTGVRTQAPVRVDASYLITAWPSESAPEDEHRLLGEVMKALLRHRTIPEEVLRGSLVGQELPLPVSSLQPGRLQSVGEFWQALGGKPKAALNYTVTLSVDVAAPQEVRLVTDKTIKIRMQKGAVS